MTVDIQIMCEQRGNVVDELRSTATTHVVRQPGSQAIQENCGHFAPQFPIGWGEESREDPLNVHVSPSDLEGLGESNDHDIQPVGLIPRGIEKGREVTIRVRALIGLLEQSDGLVVRL